MRKTIPIELNFFSLEPDQAGAMDDLRCGNFIAAQHIVANELRHGQMHAVMTGHDDETTEASWLFRYNRLRGAFDFSKSVHLPDYLSTLSIQRHRRFSNRSNRCSEGVATSRRYSTGKRCRPCRPEAYLCPRSLRSLAALHPIATFGASFAPYHTERCRVYVNRHFA